MPNSVDRVDFNHSTAEIVTVHVIALGVIPLWYLTATYAGIHICILASLNE
jgi:hypothetical protein